MNTPKLPKQIEQNNDEIIHCKALENILPRNNGTKSGVAALAASLQRGFNSKSFLDPNERINELCNNQCNSQLSNILIKEA